ncbi:MAG: hypothetical protein ACT4P7_22955, partial [Gemmatimonadaceae bacterium]
RDDLLQFSRVRVEQMQFMRRLRVVIARPILGVTYWVLWKLPRSEELPVRMRYEARNRNQNSDLEKLRAKFLGSDPECAKARRSASKLFADNVRAVLAEYCPSPDELDLSLYIPVQGAPGDRDTGGQSLPMLAPIAATYAANSSDWNKRWSASRGVAGRAFATGTLAWHIGREHQFRPQPVADDNWQKSNVSCYELYSSVEHSALFGLPIHFDSSSAVLGVLCVGSYRKAETLSLVDEMPDSENAQSVGSRAELVKRLQDAVAAFVRAKLWNPRG